MHLLGGLDTVRRRLAADAYGRVACRVPVPRVAEDLGVTEAEVLGLVREGGEQRGATSEEVGAMLQRAQPAKSPRRRREGGAS